MTAKTKFMLGMALAIIGGFAIGGLELHRHLIAFVWPTIESIWFEYFAY